MSDAERNGETFLTRMYKAGRITIYEHVRNKLKLKEGDSLRVTVMKEET